MGDWFYNLGRLAGPKWRKAHWMWKSATGDEAELLAAERQVGRDLHDAMAAEVGTCPGSVEQQFITRIGEHLAGCITNRHRTFQFTVAERGEPNAFALPGGFIFLNRSLIDLLHADADELAFVIGHEMGHVVKQHAMHRIMTDAAIGAAAKAVPVARGPAGQWIKSSALKLVRSAYSQDNELLADRFGCKIAAAGGYDPLAGVRMLQRLQSQHESHPQLPLAEYFSTHPPIPTRIAEIRKYVRSQAEE